MSGSRERLGGGRKPRLGPPGEGMFRDIVLAPDRETIPDARPLVSYAADDDPTFLREIATRRVDEYALERRGIEHGRLAELHTEGLVGPRLRRRRREALESERWVAARPIFLGGVAQSVVDALPARGELAAMLTRLHNPGGLRRLVEEHASALAPRFAAGDDLPLADPERDVERVEIREAGPGAAPLWLKSGRLSTFDGDRSLRVRVSFGEEGDDDASEDEARHASVAKLAQKLLPGARDLARLTEVNEKLERHIGGAVLGTQHIAYWNAPNGGARFHHDAFAASPRPQRGVMFAQLTGRTLWLALSIEELAGRVREVAAWIEEGDMPWVREGLGRDWSAVRNAASTRTTSLTELAAPNCGVLGALVDAPEFTACLIDAGHAVLLRPGDVLLLPNHGLERTAMHSVFCASETPGYALSVGLRGV